MQTTRLYTFIDGCPTDWLTDGNDDTWHTVVCLGFVGDPALDVLMANGGDHHLAFLLDDQFNDLLSKLVLRRGQKLELKKWKTSTAYQERFVDAFRAMSRTVANPPSINALSFQERTLRAAKDALLTEYNAGRPDRDIGFAEVNHTRDRRAMRHEFLNFGGYHQVERLENQMLPLLFVAWSIAAQYRAHVSEILRRGRDADVMLTVISDTLSGDDLVRRDSEQALKWLLDTDADTPHSDSRILVTHSSESDKHPGDLLADNLAGWFVAALAGPTSSMGRMLFDATELDPYLSWNELLPSIGSLQSRQVVQTQRQLNAARDSIAGRRT